MTDQIEEVQTPDENPAPEVAEPTKKRAYKQRAPKVKEETLDASEAPARKPRAKKSSIENTARQLEGIHKMLAMLPNMGFMQIAPDEARILAEAMVGVADEYDIQLGGKTGATINLVAAAAMIYAPRAIYVIGERKKAKQAAPVFDTESANPLTVAGSSNAPAQE